MKFKNQTQRYYYFTIDNLHISTDGVKTTGRGEILFNRRHKSNENEKQFGSITECIEWFDNYLQVNNMDKQFKGVKDVVLKGVKEISESDWVKIMKVMTVPDNLKKDDVRVYHPELAHNFVDRDNERFTKGVLDAFVRTMSGKSVLLGHNWGANEEKDFVGRIFDAYLKEVTVDEMLERNLNHPNPDIKKHLQFIEKRDGKLYILVTPFYILKDNEQLVKKVDAGIIKDISIGFRASKLEQVKEGEKTFDEYIDNGDSEGYELSFVFLGSQYGAQNSKTANSSIKMSEAVEPREDEHSYQISEPGQYESFARKDNAREISGKFVDIIYGVNGDVSEEQSIRFPVANWSKSQAEKVCEKENGILFKSATKKSTKGDCMNFKLKSLNFMETVEEDDFGKTLEKVDTLIEEALAVKDEEIKTTKALIDALDIESVTVELIEELKQKAQAGSDYKQLLVDEIVKYQVALGVLADDEDDIKEEKSLLETLPISQLSKKSSTLGDKIQDGNPPVSQFGDPEAKSLDLSFIPTAI